MNRCALATGMTKISLPKGKSCAHQPAPKHLPNHPMFCSDSIKPIVRAALGRLSHAIIAVGLRPSYVPSLAPSFIPIHSRNRDLTNWFCAGRNLVTGDPAGFLLLTTRPTREDKYLRALQVRVATWVLLIGEENGSYRPDSFRAACRCCR